MKILQMVNFSPDRNSGMVGTAMEVGDALAEAGHEVDYVWREGAPSRWEQNFSRFFDEPRLQLRQARAALAHTNYDVVVLHRPHGYRVIQELAPLHPNCLFLHFSHGWELCVPSFAPESPTLARRLKDAIATELLRRHCNSMARLAHGHFVLNRSDAAFLTDHHGVEPERICILLLGLNLPIRDHPMRTPPPTGTPARFLFVGNYVPQKGYSIMEAALLELAKENNHFTFTCVTHGDQHGGLRQRLGPTLGGRLRLLTWHKREALMEIYRTHDFLLFPSRYEGFGKVAHEAMACGLTVIGTNVGVLYDYGVHGENALLSPPGEAAGFLANLRQAAAHPELANVLGPRARITIAVDSWEHTAKCFMQFVERCHKRRAKLIH